MYPNDPSTPPQQPEQPPVTPVEPEQPASTQPQETVAPQQQEAPQQPAYAPPVQQAYQAQPVDNPGKGLGIAGFILAFFFPFIGLPLSIVGFVKSKKAGVSNGLAFAGIILNSVFIVVGIFLILITVAAYMGIQERSNTVTAATTASNVVKMAEMYAAERGGEYDEANQLISGYPKAFSDVSSMLEDTTLATAPMTSTPATANVIEFYACGDQTGNKVGYWDYTENKVAYEYAGEASESSTDCTLATQ